MKKYTKAEAVEFAQLAWWLLLDNGFVCEGGDSYRFDGLHNTVHAVTCDIEWRALDVFIRFEKPVTMSGETRPVAKINFHSFPNDTVEDAAKRLSFHIRSVKGVCDTNEPIFHPSQVFIIKK